VLSPQQLFTWRRAARKLLELPDPSPPVFVPAVVLAPDKPSSKSIRRKPSWKVARTGKGSGASIELEIDGVSVRIGRGAEAKTVAAVIGALKATS